MRRVTLIPVLAISLAPLLSISLSAQDAAAIERGQKVYVSQKCNVCHSIAGKGAKKGPLDGVATKLSTDELREWIVNSIEMTKKTKATRKPPMKNYSHLAKEDVEGLVAYLGTLKKG
jgi:mono/diheme cytochrome c family protein